MAISCAPFILDKWVASLGYDNYMHFLFCERIESNRFYEWA